MNLHSQNFSHLSLMTELPVETSFVDARRMPPPDGHPGLADHD
jgi:hypothetical protein